MHEMDRQINRRVAKLFGGGEIWDSKERQERYERQERRANEAAQSGQIPADALQQQTLPRPTRDLQLQQQQYQQAQQRTSSLGRPGTGGNSVIRPGSAASSISPANCKLCTPIEETLEDNLKVHVYL
ncbi:hypothetical protein QAD02_001846 [Eretmocerus hayati]|uniref:Uncharacterized protein n=1 Tax=Eretmocerus hayati TaxID=131215 RepID=A0ACC2NK17_9HYME|nr:hypothetical protein QAD02_001846 [Eretmocerus hayati]